MSTLKEHLESLSIAKLFREAFNAPSCSRSGIHLIEEQATNRCVLCGKIIPQEPMKKDEPCPR